MFTECPELCSAEGALSEYSRNIACRLGSYYKLVTRIQGDNFNRNVCHLS